ncbi:MAG: hypothetical protein FJ254_02810 [Phycisphaerae bacterium]|nr:hypothetical protein [Phycisphaerae bacterium]
MNINTIPKGGHAAWLTSESGNEAGAEKVGVPLDARMKVVSGIYATKIAPRKSRPPRHAEPRGPTTFTIAVHHIAGRRARHDILHTPYDLHRGSPRASRQPACSVSPAPRVAARGTTFIA